MGPLTAKKSRRPNTVNQSATTFVHYWSAAKCRGIDMLLQTLATGWIPTVVGPGTPTLVAVLHLRCTRDAEVHSAVDPPVPIAMKRT